MVERIEDGDGGAAILTFTHRSQWALLYSYHFRRMRQVLKGNYNGVCLYADRAEKYGVQKKTANHFIQLDLQLSIQRDINHLSNVT